MHNKKELDDTKVPLKPLTEKPNRKPLEERKKTDIQLFVEEEKEKKKGDFDEQIWQAITSMKHFAPILQIIAMAGAKQSDLLPIEIEHVSIYNHNNSVLKRYQYKGFKQDQSLI